MDILLWILILPFLFGIAMFVMPLHFGFLQKMREYKKTVFSTPHGSIDPRAMRGEAYDLFNTAHAFTGIHLTETGLDYLEKYMADVREVIEER